MKLHFYLGLALIAFAAFDFIHPIMPIALWYIPIIWYGYLFVVDAIVFSLKKTSMIVDHKKEFVFILLLSVPFWSIFELYNLFTNNWVYFGYTWYINIVDFTTIMPAVLESFMLIEATGLFNGIKRRIHFNNVELSIAFVFGIFSAIMPFAYPTYGFIFMWLAPFFILEPINFSFFKEGLVYRMANKDSSSFWSAVVAGPLTGFFWEMWNYFAYPKWTYNIPFFNHVVKLFAMPLPGYLGYIPFALDVISFYIFFSALILNRKTFIFDTGRPTSS